MVLVWNPRSSGYCGSIKIGGLDHLVELKRLPKSQGWNLKCSSKLAALLDKNLSQFLEILSQDGKSSSEIELLIVNLVEQAETEFGSGNDASIEFYKSLMEQLNCIGWQSVSSISEDLRCITLTMNDDCGRKHSTTINFPPNFPLSPPTCSTSLPVIETTKSSSSYNAVLSSISSRYSFLTATFDQFRQKLLDFQEFWAVMDDFDKHTWVIDPAPPSRADTYRRLAIDKNASLLVRVSPLSPRAVCECQFLGSEAIVGRLRERCNTGLFEWTSNKLPRENLEFILGIKFPTNRDTLTSPVIDGGLTSSSQVLSECGICYCVRLPIESTDSFEQKTADAKRARGTIISPLPDIVCENPKCARGFHPTCIEEWLQALPSSRHTFDTIFGNCPYCSEAIHVKRS